MERRDGYLVIDDYKKVINDKGHYWVYINGKEYYFKPIRFYDNYNELIAYYGGILLGIEMCYYDLAMLEGNVGYISKSLRNKDVKLVSGDEILLEYLKNNIDVIVDMGLDLDIVNIIDDWDIEELYYVLDKLNNLEIIWQALEYKYGNLIDIENVMKQFVMMYLFSILFVDIDKHPGNWLIIEDKNGIRLAPLIDNELILNTNCSTIGLNVSIKDGDGIFGSLERFFNISSKDYLYLFMDMYDNLRSNFDSIFDMIEKQVGIKITCLERNNIKRKFSWFDFNFNEVLSKFKNGRGK